MKNELLIVLANASLGLRAPRFSSKIRCSRDVAEYHLI